jgi:hypothetical protein
MNLRLRLGSSSSLTGIHIGSTLNASLLLLPLLPLLLLLVGSRSRRNRVQLQIVTSSEVRTVWVRENREHFLSGEPTRVCKTSEVINFML